MLESIKGIGPKNIELLKKLGIYTIDDLINYYPFRYNTYKKTELKEGSVVVAGIVESTPITTYIRKNLNKQTFRIESNDQLVNITIFNRAFLKDSLRRGSTITVIGEYSEKNNTILAEDIKLKEISNEEIEPVYHLVNKITSKQLNTLILRALDIEKNIIDYIPDYLVEKYDYIDKETSIKEIHKPYNLDKIKSSIDRLKYEELFRFMFKINYLKINRKEETGLYRDIPYNKVCEFIDKLPYKLTSDQLKSINDILDDLKSSKRMNRLLIGDVGSGKTIVSILAIYYNYLSNYQSAFLVPTEVLANQQFINISKLFSEYGIRCEILKGSLSKREKNKIKKDLLEGNIDVLIGTHAILEDNVIFKNLGLVITDEQHRFGVNQRSNLQNKGSKCDILYMSATPIPRTYALTIYGDMDISEIKTKPSGRKDIKTTLVSKKDLKSVLYDMLDEIKKGHQVYVVSPSIETEYDDLMDVYTLRDNLNKAFNNRIPLDILHGKLKPKEKDFIMDRFKNGDTKILISTTVIEVGVDVKNATMMVIFNAERFGLATIHQLRGRIGRNDLDCKCVLISNKDSERLNILTSSSDGFYIAEKDYEMRGEGDLFGTRQSGEVTFKIASLKDDMRLLTSANIDSYDFIKNNIDANFKDYPMYKMEVDKINHLD